MFIIPQAYHMPKEGHHYHQLCFIDDEVMSQKSQDDAEIQVRVHPSHYLNSACF